MKKTLMHTALFATLVLGLFACKSDKAEQKTLSGLLRSDFRTEYQDKKTDLYVLTNAGGTEICLTNYGARIVSVMVPDRDGKMQDVVLGFDNVQDYIDLPNNFGATIGRYGNRIAEGQFRLAGVTYQLPTNDHGHTLHGGPEGWDTRVFDAVQNAPNAVAMTIVSPDGDAGFPGTVTATVTFTLGDDNALAIDYKATADRATVINMTNHSYFNLSGDPRRMITDHSLYINADYFLPADSLMIPLAEPMAVEGTPMDFRQATEVAAVIGQVEFEPIRFGLGIDHNWILNGTDPIVLAARLVAPSTGIALDVFTNEPGLQVYTGNFLDGTQKGKQGIAYQHRTAICLETQHYPDSPNRPEWPSVVLEPGQTYQSRCVYAFSVE